jgi:hypothetical protein
VTWEEAKAASAYHRDLDHDIRRWPSTTQTSGPCGTRSVEFLNLEEGSFANLEQLAPLAKVATVAEAFRDFEARNDAAFDALTDFKKV